MKTHCKRGEYTSIAEDMKPPEECDRNQRPQNMDEESESPTTAREQDEVGRHGCGTISMVRLLRKSREASRTEVTQITDAGGTEDCTIKSNKASCR